MAICDRSTCFAFNEKVNRNCNILTKSYKKSEDCPFYKKKSDVNIKEIKKACAEYKKG